jgi:hypothetical protein
MKRPHRKRQLDAKAREHRRFRHERAHETEARPNKETKSGQGGSQRHAAEPCKLRCEVVEKRQRAVRFDDSDV